jgi:transmembrane sensor
MNGEQPTSRMALRSEAAHWYNQRLAGDMTAQDEYRFRDWINRSPAHRAAYQSIDKAWFIAGTAMDDPALTGDPTPVRAVASRWRLPAVAASALLVIGVGSMTLTGLLVGGHESPVQAFRTGTGQRSTITLPDGSIVTLDSATAMRFNDLPGERHVELLGGRAFFKVAKNRSRPFTVTAAGKRVLAVGTAFEVSMDGGEVAVVLAEGEVRVEETRNVGNGTDMTPGRQLVIAKNRRWTITNVDVEKETGWTQGHLIFMHDSLSKAIAEVNRYSTRKLIFKDGPIPDRDIVGVFSAGDVESFIKALEMNGIAKRVSTTPDEIVLARHG